MAKHKVTSKRKVTGGVRRQPKPGLPKLKRRRKVTDRRGKVSR